MTETLDQLRARPHLSVSALKSYIQCPRKYFFHYVDRAPVDFRAVALVFGTAWHTAIGRWLSALPTPPAREEVQAAFRDALVGRLGDGGAPVLFEDDEDEGKLVDVGLGMLDAFLKKIPPPDFVLGVEIPFSTELAHPKTGEVLPVPLVGALDAIVLERGRGFVWELKTGKKKYAQDQLEFDLQPTAYVKAAREAGYQDIAVKLLVTTKTARPDVQVEALVRHRADEEELAEVALGVHRAVAAGVDHPLRGWWCRSCPYGSRCR